MIAPYIIRKTALAVFKDKKMLMVRASKHADAFFTLGGKIEDGESELDSLHREVLEEAGAKIIPDSIEFLNEFEAPAFGKENTLVNIRLYTGELDREPFPSSEIEEIQFFDSKVDLKHLTAITIEMFKWLKNHGYIH